MTGAPRISAEDVDEARIRLYNRVHVTPLLETDELNAVAGRRVLVKAECLQRSGSFKFRGAMNRLLVLTPETRERGVVAFSSGNHGKAIAVAARLLGVQATIIMPKDAPAVKISGVKREGASIVLYDREGDDRDAIAQELVARTGATLIPPFDDVDVIAGQGTVASEVVAAVAQLNVLPSHFIVPCSGGGLAAGCASVLSRTRGMQLIVAEPEGFDDAALSLTSGTWVANAKAKGSICDALLARTLGNITLPILQEAATQGVTVSDQEVLEAMRTAVTCLKIVLEPGGAAALAAVLAGKIGREGTPVVVVASGGNVDEEMLGQALNDKLAARVDR